MISSIYIACAVFVLLLLEPLLPDWIDLRLKHLGVEFQKMLMKFRLEWDIFWMKKNMRKYMRMAAELRKDLGMDDGAK